MKAPNQSNAFGIAEQHQKALQHEAGRAAAAALACCAMPPEERMSFPADPDQIGRADQPQPVEPDAMVR